MTFQPKQVSVALLLLLIPWASAQAIQCAPDGSPQLRFVAQLSVRGCALFVHDTRANDGPHLAVEPVMCVTASLHRVLPRYDTVTQQRYVSVPVTLRDDAMLRIVRRRLQHLSQKSVKFANVSDISVSTISSSLVRAVGFIWSPEESVGFLRLRCVRRSGSPCLPWQLSRFIFEFRAAPFEALKRVRMSATLANNTNCGEKALSYRLAKSDQGLLNPDFSLPSRYAPLPTCQQLRFLRTISLPNCSARVYQDLDRNNHLIIEPLLCHNISSLDHEPVRYDYSRDMHFLKLDLVLQDENDFESHLLSQLSEHNIHSFAFMRLWRAQSVQSSDLIRRFTLGPLMVSADWKSAQLRVYCRSEAECNMLKSQLQIEPTDLWRHIRWNITSLVSDSCMEPSVGLKYSVRLTAAGDDKVEELQRTNPEAAHKLFHRTVDGRVFVVIQQRLTGDVSFQRNWAEYERGFGDETDFWIGLSTIHSFSMDGVTFRMEMKVRNGTELHAEYAGFKVGDASTNYLMTYREMLRDRSNVSVDAMDTHKGLQFSTMDRDNSGRAGESLSIGWGSGGWWFGGHLKTNPNGPCPYHGADSSNFIYCSWYVGYGYENMREVRLMLQI